MAVRSALGDLDRIDVLAVNGDPSPTPWLDEAYFLRAALDPTGLGVVEVATPFRLTVVPTGDLGTRDLSGYRAVILANVADLPREPALALATYVKRGGGLVVFAGSRTDPDSMRATFGPGGPAEGVLPRLPVRPLSVSVNDEPLPRLTDIDATHAIFRGLSEGFRTDLSRVRCTQAPRSADRLAGAAHRSRIHCTQARRMADRLAGAAHRSRIHCTQAPRSADRSAGAAHRTRIGAHGPHG